MLLSASFPPPFSSSLFFAALPEAKQEPNLLYFFFLYARVIITAVFFLSSSFLGRSAPLAQKEEGRSQKTSSSKAEKKPGSYLPLRKEKGKRQWVF